MCTARIRPAARHDFTTPTRSLRVAAVGLQAATLAATLLAAFPASADRYAEPPSDAYRHDRRSDAVVAEPDDENAPPPLEPSASIVRFFAGPAGKVDKAAASPGLLVAADFGRGPAGFRLTGAWLDVGTERGVSQYTGELTIDFGGRSRFRPVVGAGGGVARTSSSVREDGSVDPSTGATLGVGLVRAGLGYRLPFQDADARVALDFTGVLPAIRGATSPELGPWALGAITVGIGF